MTTNMYVQWTNCCTVTFNIALLLDCMAMENCVCVKYFDFKKIHHLQKKHKTFSSDCYFFHRNSPQMINKHKSPNQLIDIKQYTRIKGNYCVIINLHCYVNFSSYFRLHSQKFLGFIFELSHFCFVFFLESIQITNIYIECTQNIYYHTLKNRTSKKLTKSLQF